MIQPALPASAYKTYLISAPRSTHTRPATCEEVECDAWKNGWITKIDVSTDLGQRQAKYILNHGGRKFSRNGVPDSTDMTITFTFPAGQKCFSEHRVPLEREALFVVHDGDQRGNPTGWRRQHVRPEDWVEDFAEHQIKLSDQLRKG